MRGLKPNILILLSNTDRLAWLFLYNLPIIYGSQAYEQFLNGLRYITTLIYIIAVDMESSGAQQEESCLQFGFMVGDAQHKRQFNVNIDQLYAGL